MDNQHLATSASYSPFGTIGTTSDQRTKAETAYEQAFGGVGSTVKATNKRIALGPHQLVFHNSGTGLAFAPYIVPGVGPNGTTTYLETNPLKFGKDTKIQGHHLLMPGQVPFMATPHEMIPDHKQLPLQSATAGSVIHDWENYKNYHKKLDLIEDIEGRKLN